MSFGDKAHCWPKSLEEVAVCRPTQSVPALACLSSHAFCFIIFVLKKIPNFCLGRPFEFSIHRECVSFYVPYFCLDRPFGFSVHRDAHLLPKSPFQAFNLASLLMIFFDYDCILLKAEILSTVPSHVSLPECNRSWGGCGCTLPLLMNSKKVCLLFTLFKRCKKVFVFWNFLLQVLPSKNRRNFVCRINESSK